MSWTVSVDDKMNTTERVLSWIAAYPIVGTVAGAAKIGLGSTQAVVAVASLFFTVPRAIVKKDATLVRYSFHHIKHGTGNIMAGTFEIVPLFGTYAYVARMNVATESGMAFACCHMDKILPYSSLMSRDACLRKGNAKQKALFRQMIADYEREHRRYVSYSKLMQFSKEILPQKPEELVLSKPMEG